MLRKSGKNRTIQQNRTLPILHMTGRLHTFAPKASNSMSEYQNIHYIDEDVALMTDIKDLSEYNAAKMDSYIFLACRKGKLQVDINGKSYMVHGNTNITFLPNNYVDNILIGVDANIVMLKLSVRIVSELMREHIDSWNRMIYVHKAYFMPSGEEQEEQMQYYYRLILSKMSSAPKPYHKEIIRSIIHAILLEMLSNMEMNSTRSDDDETRVKSHFNRFLNMLSNTSVKHRPVKYYADKLCMSSKYLSEVCKKVSQKSACTWIEEFTNEDIRYHLFNTDLAVKEIAYKLGFENLSFFGKYVKRHFGQSPTALRENVKNK